MPCAPTRRSSPPGSSRPAITASTTRAGSRRAGTPLGVIVVEVDLDKFERGWAGISDAVLVTDSEGTIILATEPRWRGLQVSEALERAAARQRDRTGDPGHRRLDRRPADAYIRGEAVMRIDGRIPFRGWSISVLHHLCLGARAGERGTRARDHGSSRSSRRCAFYVAVAQDGAADGALPARERRTAAPRTCAFNGEIAERERVQENLAVAEQTLAQSSKLAALGEMSAAVSHELNQPLAAMKTYLAGARLLLQPQPARGGAGRVPPHRRPDRAHGRHHPAAQILCPQGRRRLPSGRHGRCARLGAVDDGAAAEVPAGRASAASCPRQPVLRDGRPGAHRAGDGEPSAQRARRHQERAQSARST